MAEAEGEEEGPGRRVPWREALGLPDDAAVSVKDLRAHVRACQLSLALEGKRRMDPGLMAAYSDGLRELLRRRPHTGVGDADDAAAAEFDEAAALASWGGDERSLRTLRPGDSAPLAKNTLYDFHELDALLTDVQAEQVIIRPSANAWDPTPRERAVESPDAQALDARAALDEIAELLGRSEFNDLTLAMHLIQDVRDPPENGRQRVSVGDFSVAHLEELDRLEAEGLRQLARLQADAGRPELAIQDYLDRAILLDPTRAALLTLRAFCRLQPPLRVQAALLSERGSAQLQAALEDCRAASALDEGFAEAYEVGLRALLALGDLEAAEELAERGAAAVQDDAKTAAFRAEWKYISSVRRNLGRAESLLDERQPQEAEGVVGMLEKTFGERLEPPIRKRIEKVRHCAKAMEHNT